MTADIWSDPHHPDCVITHDPADSYYQEFVAGTVSAEHAGGPVGRIPFPAQPGSATLQVRRVRKGHRRYLVPSA